METDGGRPGGEPPPILDGKNCTVLHNSKRIKKNGGPPRDGPPCFQNSFYGCFGHSEAHADLGLYNNK